MRLGTALRRVLTPGFVVTVHAYFRYGCFVSPRAEVEITPNLRIGRKSVIGSFTKLKATDGPLRIGSNVEIATGCLIGSHAAGLEIGDDCLIGPNVSIIGNNYSYDRLDVPIRLQEKVSTTGVRIGDNVWIGAGCVILDGADIGSGSILAPNSVVAGPLPANSIALGNPAKVIFTRR
ncbi:MAG TPA: acyltransferase [Thermoanaerobaculia bacterium]|jgi:acetyltransferase-like isoleucine patch superfamily enzyme